PPAPRTAAARLRSRSGSISTRSGSSLSPPAKKAPRARPGPQVLHIPPAVSRPAAPAPAVFTRWPEESAACEGIGADYSELRRRTFGVDRAPLPSSLPLSKADEVINRRAKLVRA